MYSLYIGRFQPFHLGHLDAIKQCLQDEQNLIIGVGSADDNWLPENPFNCGERISMVKFALDEAKINPERYLIIPVWNINNYALWPEHAKILLPEFNKVYTASDVVAELFSNYGKIEIKRLNINIKVDATAIRQYLLENNWEKAKKLLPLSTYNYLQKIGAARRLQTIKDLVRK